MAFLTGCLPAYGLGLPLPPSLILPLTLPLTLTSSPTPMLSPLQERTDSVPIGNLPAGLLTTPKSYTAPRAVAPLKIDGHLDDLAWQQAPWTELFTDISGIPRVKGIRVDKASEILPTRVKMCWDAHNLYIAAELKDPDLWATLLQRDTIIYHNNDFEVFFTTSPDVTSYYELEINQLGTLLDLFMTRPYRNGGKALIHWDLNGLQSAVQLHGSLNNPLDRDSGWTLEFAIPFTSVLAFGQPIPQAGSYWRMNFSRVQWDLTKDEKGYQRKKSRQGRVLPEHNWVWSPQGIVNMHAPERWGYLFFAKDSSVHGINTDTIPLIELQKQVLWKCYYKEHFQFSSRQKFALTLGELGVESEKVTLMDPHTGKPMHYTLALTAGENWFRVALKDQKGAEKMALDQNGMISILK